ncbi:Proline iminopeptidase [Orchesella cincta]|uniref:Proline iminopeptidase n=1 Tax=Orchesella cincta TaxID=48709 RepID=A0A1D2N2Y8_ORCCI|nr:Proline iminopeptidase [Orchesella cincta]
MPAIQKTKTGTIANDKMGDEIALYSAIQPRSSGFLEVSPLHKIYYEECGIRDGIPVIFIHGGPGGGIGERDRRYFDPDAYRIVLFDQRGAGKSTPAFSLEENDTWSLVADIEKLREHLGIEKWVVFGGSWGATLALVYAETHINRVLAMILRGICTLRKEELAWFYQEGASYLFPDYWEDYIAPIPEEERGDFISAYYKRLNGDNEEEQLRCARAWSKWEMALSQLRINHENLNKCADDFFSLALAQPNHVLDNANIIHESGISVTIVHGRYDVCCPAKTAWELYKKLPNAEFYLIEDAGHSAKEEGITKKLVEACDKYKTLVKV